MRMERKRTRLLRLLFFSGLALLGVIIFELNIGILPLTLTMAVFIALYLVYLGYEVLRFLQTFKPNVLNLLLTFIGSQSNMGKMTYVAKRSLPKSTFFDSCIFVTDAQIFEGEDYISGRVGEMDFELCELNVRDFSVVRNRTNYVFKGVFLHAIFPENVKGNIVIWPREFRQYLSRSIREFTRTGAYNVDDEVMNPAFRKLFTTYATEETHVAGILSEPMQDSIVEYCNTTGKEMYISFLGKNIYLAVTEPRDLMEPYIFRSNLSFELVRGFWQDLSLLIEIVEDFDKTH
jgi:hypothetical protein